ncbi:hydroxymethylglutaryl-CoA lyase [Variovorax sp. M-6]|uniref:hydroxymethylglutaryl-CoA lyase n=1 Tax=Variovorax sp. M-6 TaxID=3233041 RepID=UPI003F9BB4A1
MLYITDVGPRDGLQSQGTIVGTEGKRALIEALFAAGLRRIEATSFVSPKAVPQMADADALLRGLAVPDDARVSVLVPNQRGLERAVDAGAREIAVVLSATETMNRKNIRMDLDAALNTCRETLAEAVRAGLRTRAYVAVAFACPFEGDTPTGRVVDLALQMRAAGAEEIVIADTIGAAAPSDVERVLGALLGILPAQTIGMHFHDTRGMALANAWCAMARGIRRFDASIGGVGGCPFAPGAAGNLATEDLALMAHQCGFETGIELGAIGAAIETTSRLVGYPVGGRSQRWLARAQA